MKKIFLLLILFFVANLCANSQEDEYWTLAPGSLGQYLIQIDSSTMVLITNEWVFVEEDGYYRNSSLNFHYFNIEGEYVNTWLLNFHEIDSLIKIEPIKSIGRIAGRNSMTKLANGNYVAGGHGNVVSKKKLHRVASNKENEKHQKSFENSFNYDYTLYSEYNDLAKDDSPPMANPMIFTFNSALDSLLRVDTLEAVPHYGSVVLIREIAPDTLIIGYHKSNESRHDIMETDSLFNVRWKTEFGQIDGWLADIYDFEVTSDGDYLVSMYYNYLWSSRAYYRNRLFKFCKNTGELLWQKIIRNDNNLSFMFTLTALEDDKYLLAYDDCCLPPSGTNSLTEYVFHENTGLHLRIIDSDGNTLEQKSLVDFLSAHLYTYGEPTDFCYENPDEAAPWYRPLQTIKNPDNTFLISGILTSTGTSCYLRGFLLKLDEDLEPLWVRVFEIDKKNYFFDCINVLRLNNILNTGDNIFLGGTFESICTYPINYEPFYYDYFFWSGILIPLDEYGCYEPDCHLFIDTPEWEYDSYITFFPNPANTTLNILIDRQEIEHKQKTLFISDFSGHGMLTKHFTGNELQVSVKDFSPGVYIAYILSEGHILKAEKIVVGR